MIPHPTAEPRTSLDAARWIGFSEEIVQIFRAPTPALRPAVGLLARLSEVRALHAARGIPETITQATLRDMEMWLRQYRQKHGAWGFAETGWLNLHFSGRLYALGRLQFEVGHCDGPAIPGVLAQGAPVVKIHIPATGKLADTACGQSLRQAGAFFPRYFPEHRFQALTCVSWMMDRQLERWLPADSNLVRFLHRFHPYAIPNATDDQMWERVFGGRVANLATAPRDTALQRAMLDHLAAGGQWRTAGGYLLRSEIR